MSVAKLVAIGDSSGEVRSFKVEGTTYDPQDGTIHDWPAGSIDANLETIAKVAAVCNDASVAHSSHQYVATGMPTEAALKVRIAKLTRCSRSAIVMVSESLRVYGIIHQLQMHSDN
jgi:Ca2+-transporting ATPase